MTNGTQQQHYIPNVLLKRFSYNVREAKDRKAKHRIWTFRQGKKPLSSLTTEVAKQGNFYGKDGPGSLERKFGEYETAADAVLDRIVANGFDKHDAAFIDSFSNQLSFRTRAFRSTMQTAVGWMIEETLTQLQSGKHNAKFLPNAVATACTTFEVAKVLRSKPPEQRAALIAQITELVRRGFPSAIESTVSKFRALDYETLFAGKHNDSMLKHFSGDKTSELTGKLDWTLVKDDQGSIVLGDLVIVAENQEGVISHSATDGPAIQRVYLPVSPSHIIVGTRPHYSRELPPISVLNERMSSLSFEMFLSKNNTARETALHKLLGANSDIVSRAEVIDIVREGLAANPSGES